MRKLLVALLLILSVKAHAATWFSCAGDTFCGASTQPYGNCSIDIAYQSDSPTGNPNVWRWTYAKDTPGGEGIAAVWLPQPPGGAQEMWAQWYWKYSPGFSYHDVMNKQLYFQPSNTMGMGISGGGVAGNAHVMMITQGPNMKAHEPLVDMNSWYANTGIWHKYKARYVLNTGNQYNGIYQAWIDDVMVANYSNVYYQDGTSQISSPVMMVIYGGIGGSVPQTQYLYMAGLYIGSTDPGGAGGGDTQPPYVSAVSPLANSTGQDNTNRVVTATVPDAGGGLVTRSSVNMKLSINGGTYSTYAYGSGLTFVPSTATASSYVITRTQASDFSAGAVVSRQVNATDNNGNVMSQYADTFTMAPAGTSQTKTKAQVLSYLQALPNQSGKKVLSGQMIGWCGSEDSSLFSTINNIGGHYPAIMSGNYAYGGGYWSCSGSGDLISNTNAYLKAHWAAGGLVEIGWHANNPLNNLWDHQTVSLTNIVTPGQSENANWKAMLDNVAAALQDLENDNVVVLWRPLLEMNGWPSGGFWWNGEDGTQFKNLWIYTYNYLVTTKGLSNLIWVFSTHGDGNTSYGQVPSTWYPGNAYVDIVGSDVYTTNGRYTNPYWYSHFSTYTKPFAFTETSTCYWDITSNCTNSAAYLISDIKVSAPNTIWWNAWEGWWAMDKWSNLSTLLGDAWVVNRDDNPSGALTAASITITTTALPNGTVGRTYSQQLTLAAVGGMSPFVWDNTGVLPPGLALSSVGVISGTPTTAGTWAWTAGVTDNTSTTDTQALSITIDPPLPGGQTTVTGTSSVYTFINSGAPTTNYLGSLEAYQWPSATVANRILLQDNTAKGLPDNISITAATLRLRVSSWEGSGGTQPMRIHAYNVTGTIPTLSTVTWNSFAGTLSSALSTTDVPLSTGWGSWNVLSAAQAAKTGNATMTLALDGGQDGASDTNRIFDAAEIVITYTQLVGPGGPSISAPGKMRVSKMKGSFR